MNRQHALRLLNQVARKRTRASLVEVAGRSRRRQVTRPMRMFLGDLEATLDRYTAPSVAVLVGKRPSQVAKIVATARPRAQVTAVDIGSGESAVHARLAAAGPFQVVVDDTRVYRAMVERFKEALYQLDAGGTLLVRHPGVRPPRAEPTAEAGLWELVGRLAHLGAHKGGRSLRGRSGRSGRQLAYLASAVGRITLDARHMVVAKRGRTLVKLREDEMDAVLAARSDQPGRVIERRPARELRSRCVLHDTAGKRSRGMPEVYRVPPVSLREYHDVLCLPGQVALQENLVLPDTFRHHKDPVIWNRFLPDASERFAQVPSTGTPLRLRGAYFYLDSEWPGHFGHCMTEQMSRLWAWPQAKALFPDLKALLALKEGATGLTAFERGIFASAGIHERDIVLMDGPVQVEHLVAATPMFSMPKYVHPDIEDTWRAVGDALVAGASERDWPQRIFCSRRIAKRACSNVDEVEGLFRGQGFEVVYPEDFPLADQVRLFREAEVVAGFAGSGLFTLSLSDSPKRVIMISSKTTPRATST